MTEPLEGVIKFSAQHTDVALDPRLARSAADLDAWRSLFVQLELIGQDPKRYQGLGFGNLSARITTERGETQFLISGSQTGAKPELELADFSLVSSWTVEQNSLVSTGQTPPSSESLTHGAFYDADPAIRFVFHAHSPEIWHGARSARAQLHRARRRLRHSGDGPGGGPDLSPGRSSTERVGDRDDGTSRWCVRQRGNG
jgi:hypothetical protein